MYYSVFTETYLLACIVDFFTNSSDYTVWVNNSSRKVYKMQTVFIWVRYFSCNIGEYNTRPMNKVFAWRLTPYLFDECCILQYCMKNKQI